MSEGIRCLIVDDEPLARDLLRKLITADADLEVIGECSCAADAMRAVLEWRPDLVFLDVQMPGGSGFDALAGLPRTLLPHVIFVTAHDRYALRAFDVHAVDYLLKPFSKERFRESLGRAKMAIRQGQMEDLAKRMASLASAYSDLRTDHRDGARRGAALVVRQGASRIRVEGHDVVWIEAADQYARIHTLAASHLLSRSLTSLERELDAGNFFRIHRSALVNARFVTDVVVPSNGPGSVVLRTGQRLPLSRRRRGLIPRLRQRAAALA